MNSFSSLINRNSPEILRARTWVYGGLGVLIIGMMIPTGAPQLVVMLPLIGIALVVPLLVSPSNRVSCALLVDTGVAVASWWFFGPDGGTDFILLILAAVAGIMYDGRRRNWLIGVALSAELVQIPLHFLAKASGGLPLFHEPGQVIGDGEFVAGVLVRLSVLILASALFVMVGRGIRSSRSALAASEGTFRGAFEEAPIGVAVVSPRGSVLKANREIMELLPGSPNSESGFHIAQLFRNTDYPAVEDGIKEILYGELRRLELQLTSASESDPRILRVALSGVDLAEGEQAAVITMEDITERINDHRRLEELVRSKDEFVASVSHELRTPLTAVVGFAQILSESWQDLTGEELQMLIEDIARESRDVASIVEDLLVIARADIGTVTLIPELLDFEDELSQVIGGLGSDVSGRISFDCQPARLWGDPTRFRQILRNLLTNAIRYGGEHISVCSAVGQDHVEISVEDDGPGIDGSDPERIFQPYVRAHENPTQPASVGLGLAVARSLARAMGGDLSYGRSKGLTRFTLTVPAAEVSLQVVS